LVYSPEVLSQLMEPDDAFLIRRALDEAGLKIVTGTSAKKIIANAGGVICAAMEYQSATQSAALQTIQEKLRRNTQLVLDDARQRGVLPRQAAVEMAEQRVRKAMSMRRFSLFSTAPGWV
jgi:glutamate dehydrogenase/leucine dehydrogenase